MTEQEQYKLMKIYYQSSAPLLNKIKTLVDFEQILKENTVDDLKKEIRLFNNKKVLLYFNSTTFKSVVNEFLLDPEVPPGIVFLKSVSLEQNKITYKIDNGNSD